MVKTRQAWKCSSSVAYTVDISLLNSEILPYIGHHLAISPELTFPPSCEISCYVIDNDRSWTLHNWYYLTYGSVDC